MFSKKYTLGGAAALAGLGLVLASHTGVAGGPGSVGGKIVYTVRRADLIPLEEVFYDEDGEPMRAMIFWDVKTLGGRSLPAVLEMVPLNKEGHKTVIRYLDARFDADLGTDVFTLRKLRGRR